MLVDLHAQLADSAEVTEDQTHDQRAAGGAQVKGTSPQRNVDATQNCTGQYGQCECTQAELIHFKQLLLLQRTFIAGINRGQLCPFFCHVGFQHLRHNLYEQDNADNAERICHCVIPSYR